MANEIEVGQVWERRRGGVLYEVIGLVGAFDRYVRIETTDRNGKVRRRELLVSTLRKSYRLCGAEEEPTNE